MNTNSTMPIDFGNDIYAETIKDQRVEWTASIEEGISTNNQLINVFTNNKMNNQQHTPLLNGNNENTDIINNNSQVESAENKNERLNFDCEE